MNRTAHRQRAFTLVELLVTIVIVGILATAVLPLSELSHQREQEKALREALREIRRGIDAYKQASDEGRIARKSDESGYPHNLSELVEGVADARDPKGTPIYFLRRIPRDPFSPDRSVSPDKSWGLRSYASSYEEPKAGNDVFDVYSTAPGEALDGTLYKEW